MAQTIINSIMPSFKLQAYRKGEGFHSVMMMQLHRQEY